MIRWDVSRAREACIVAKSREARVRSYFLSSDFRNQLNQIVLEAVEEFSVMRSTLHELSIDSELLATLWIRRASIVNILTNDWVIRLSDILVIGVQKSTVGVAPLWDIVIVVSAPRGRVCSERITTWPKVRILLLITDHRKRWLIRGLINVLNLDIRFRLMVKSLLKLCFFCHQATTLNFRDLICFS